MFCNNTRLSFFACQKNAAGAALKKAAPALGSGQIENLLRLWLHPKSGGSGSATLVLRAFCYSPSPVGAVTVIVLYDVCSLIKHQNKCI